MPLSKFLVKFMRMGCDRERRAGSTGMGCTVCDYAKQWPELAAEFTRRMKGDCLLAGPRICRNMCTICNPIRGAGNPSGQPEMPQSLRGYAPELMGGSADLSPSNLTRHQNRLISPGKIRRGITSPMACVIWYVGHHERSCAAWWVYPLRGTFLMFMEYARNALRMAALIRSARCLFIPTIPSAWAKTAHTSAR